MALPDLAVTADLGLRGIETDAIAAELLTVASSIVRGAAASPILKTTSTVTLTGWWCEPWLRLPGPPVTSVTSAAIDGDAVTDWRLADSALWRRTGWGVDDGPAEVDVTLTHGLVAVPPHIVDLVCSLVGAGVAAAGEGYASNGNVVAERIDDYSVTFAAGADAVASVMELPKGSRRHLRSQFGGSAGVVIYR